MSKLPTSFKFDADRIAARYPSVRNRLRKDPLFTKNAEDFDVSIEQLDARMLKIPKTCAGFYDWLDGADQYRYAGLALLFATYGRSAAPVEFAQSLAIPAERTVLFAGDVTIHGSLSLGAGALIIVLGTLHIDGVLLAPDDYSLVAAHNIVFASGISSGELIALTSIVGGQKVYLTGNDHSCRAKSFKANILVDFERCNAFTRVVAKTRISTWSVANAACALEVAADQDLPSAFTDLLLGKTTATIAAAAPLFDEEALWDAARQSPTALALLLPGPWQSYQLAIALKYAAQWDQPKAVQLLLAHGAAAHAHAALSEATQSVAVLDLLLNACENSAEQTVDGQPLLHLACNVGSEAVIARLLARGFNVNATNHLGVTALHVCAWHGHVAKAKLLLKHGAAKDRQTTAAWHDFVEIGATPIDVANNQLKNQAGAKPWRDVVGLLR